ncbi:hypothetical protein FNYG_10949 [Fusarium nygamai]|uniref:Uncharacterized protein n=1 Tax=Gibberella nygamai TaxID=42673 RepID=A0A2K0VZU5_GIBNY|nr:hypothetical protein FNYG_10949 [Fusarium nygamai]
MLKKKERSSRRKFERESALRLQETIAAIENLRSRIKEETGPLKQD